MFRALIVALAAIIPLAAAYGDGQKSISLRKTSSPITIDGFIEPAWSDADSASDFFQLAPFYDKAPTRSTTAKILTSSDALYCIMICYDRGDSVQAVNGTLDNTQGDIVSIMLDTFDDKRSAYKLAVTASGVRADCRLLDDGRNRDYNWDGIWSAASRVYNWGFVVEMEIPYRSIQYAAGLHEWGLDFDRWIPAQNEDLYWNRYQENEGQRISKFGRLIFQDLYPSVKGLNLEVYPVGIGKTSYVSSNNYHSELDAGLDIFYNPSEQLTFQLTANPDFAQIEADPFSFNISRYETHYNERRPFFTQGNEIFLPSGKDRNSGFYSPMELFYSRRIGRKLPDGSEVPLVVGSKAFGRADDWEYGGFLAVTGEKDYTDMDGAAQTEPRAEFGAVRLKKQLWGNSSIGVLGVAKHSLLDDNGVVDIDGAFRSSSWQLAYQLARSFRNSEGGFAGSFGFRMIAEKWATLLRGRSVGGQFDVEEVGFVPWVGTHNFVGLTGPRWYFPEGTISEILVYGGPTYDYKEIEQTPDYGALLGMDMNFRSNWGYEIDLSYGSETEAGITFYPGEIDLSSWFNISPVWNANVYGGYSKTYNFSRDYLAFYSWAGGSFSRQATRGFTLGTSYDMFIEGNPEGHVEDITYDARPFVSCTPVNNVNVRFYVDNVFLRSTDHIEQRILGFLFSYNFLPKSWVYIALNDMRDRSPEFDGSGVQLPQRLHIADQAAVVKLKYLYYF
jgi:hypothetical protein